MGAQQAATPQMGTAGNLPQRNRNPGNLKIGGAGNAFAMKGPDGSPLTDPQGHLIFPNPEAGFQALMKDIQMKINGASKFLPANPTLSQLGRVYAEDPRWGEKVSAITGIPLNAQLNNSHLAALAQGIAAQEGFFAGR
jgi:hypothetical protein